MCQNFESSYPFKSPSRGLHRKYCSSAWHYLKDTGVAINWLACFFASQPALSITIAGAVCMRNWIPRTQVAGLKGHQTFIPISVIEVFHGDIHISHERHRTSTKLTTH
ncbi:hypothetical protein BDR07DRAFT_1412913 [Suillus spraguei]|nr:hypothetical protein BDR07DRAFT_1412913 [Suillus spraguei]